MGLSAMPMTMKKWLRAVAEMAEAEGLRDITIDSTSGRHCKLRGMAGINKAVFVVFSRTPADFRAAYKVRTDIRREART
jgi:hypothetical protein